MARITLEELFATPEPVETATTTSPVSPTMEGVPQEVVDYINDQSNIEDHIVDAEPTASQQVMGYGGGALVEMGLGFGSTYALSKNTTYAKHLNRVVQTVKTIKNTGRGVAAVGAGAAVAEPISTVGSLAFLGITEAASWGLSNYAGQNIRKAYGLQDNIHGSELIAASLFGIVARPVEGLQVLDDMGKAINAAIPVKFEASGLVAAKAWKGREIMVKGAPRFVSGASLGLAESAFRQEMAIAMGDQETRNTYDYLFSAGFGGGFNSLFHVFNKTGAWGREQATTLSERASNRIKEAIGDIDTQLETATRHKKRKLLKQKRTHQTSLDMIEDFKAKVDEQAANIDNNANQEINQPIPELVKQRQGTTAPISKNSELSYKELQAKAKEAQIPANQKKQILIDELDARETPDVPEQALKNEEAGKLIDELQADYDKVKEDSAYESARPEITRRARNIYDAADFDTVNAIERLNVDPNDQAALDLLLESSEIKLRMKDGILGELNNSSGNAVAANKRNQQKITPTKYSVATEVEIDSLNQLISVIRKRKGVTADEALDLTNAGKKASEKQALKAKAEATTPAPTKKKKQPTRAEQAKTDAENQELYNAIYDAAYAEADANQSGTLKFFNGVRVARKLAMVNSVTSAQAAFPTGAFEMGRLFVKPIGTLITQTSEKGLPVAARLMVEEFKGSAEAYSFLWKAGEAQQLFKHMKRTFQEGADPNYQSSTKFSDDYAQQRVFKHGTEREILKKAKMDAQAQVEATNSLIGWAKRHAVGGKFVSFMSLGARAIMATDAGFKRQLRIAAARTKARQKAILAHPDDQDAAVKYADELYQSWTKDRNGLEVLDGQSDLSAEFADIDGALLMSSTTDDIGKLEKGFFETMLVDPFDKLMRSDMNRFGAATMEAIMPFYKIGVRSVARGTRFASFGISKNPYTKTIRDLEMEIKTQDFALRHARNTGNKDGATRKAAMIKNLKERKELIEVRQLQFKKEQVTDAIVAGGLYASGILMGYNGQITGTNAWMTPEQKKNNPNVKSFKLFGADYRAGVPFNLPLAIAADIGAYFKMRDEEARTGTQIIAPNINLATVMMDSVANVMKELPLNEGVRQARLVTDSQSDDRLVNMSQVLEKLVYSYVPVPSQAKKIVKHFSSGGSVSDLKGGTFYERMSYNLFGKSTRAKKLNALGEEVKNTRGVEFTFNRFAVEKTFEPTPFERAKQADHYNKIPDLPKRFEGMDMYSLVDAEGIPLRTRWAERLREVEIDRKTLSEAVSDFLTGDRVEYKGELVDYFDISLQNRPNPDGTTDNKGLMALGNIINRYYRETNKQILKDEDFLNRFIDKDNKTLLYIVETLGLNEADDEGFVEGRAPVGIEPYFKK